MPKLAAKFGFVRRRFASQDDCGLRLKQTHDFFWCRNRFVLKDLPSSLRNHAAHQGHILCEEVRQRWVALATALSQTDLHLLDLRENGFDDLDQVVPQPY